MNCKCISNLNKIKTKNNELKSYRKENIINQISKENLKKAESLLKKIIIKIPSISDKKNIESYNNKNSINFIKSQYNLSNEEYDLSIYVDIDKKIKKIIKIPLIDEDKINFKSYWFFFRNDKHFNNCNDNELDYFINQIKKYFPDDYEITFKRKILQNSKKKIKFHIKKKKDNRIKML